MDVRRIATVLAPLLFATSALAGDCDDGDSGGRVVTVSGRHLGALEGISEKDLRAWRYQDGERSPVPFQVEACDDTGRAVLAAPGEARKALRLETTGAVLLRVSDGGERGPAAPGVAEIAIAATGDGERRWLYLGADEAVPRSTADDVDYDPVADAVHGARYTLRFHRPYADYFSPADGKGRDRGNLLDRMKARVTARFLWGLIQFRRSEEQVGEELVGYEDGPIRAMRRVRLHVEIGWGIPSPDIVADDYFYADHAEAPVQVRLPFSLAYVFGDLDVRLYLDFRSVDGLTLAADGLEPRPLQDGGRSSVDAPPKTSWFALAGSDVVFLHRLRLGPTLGALDCRLLFESDGERADPPERERGVHAVGYRLTGWSAVGRGRHTLWMDTYVVDRGAAEDPRSAIASLSTPLRVEVTAGRGAPDARTAASAKAHGRSSEARLSSPERR